MVALFDMAKMGKRLLINFFYDTICPYSWIAFEALLRYKSLWNIELKLRPVLLTEILRIAGNKSALTLKGRSKQNYSDLKLMAHYWEIPLNVSENFVERQLQNSSENVQKFLTVIAEREPLKLLNASRYIWLRFWSHQQWTDKKEDLTEIANLIPVNETLVRAVFDSSTKESLDKTTEEAVSFGAFGVPWIVATDAESGVRHQFFGSDRLPLIAHVFKLPFRGPVPSE